ncbi:vault protein inter-alpha-trypsin domain-containing protein [Favolaschia claudopus]|uniref:Vault protein inter-alpha-trypsin domain-containing protein n=1 Tax=Favolaschia claudopus TaxID=2862362 RepID=A0AAW0DBU4_9AGAR
MRYGLYYYVEKRPISLPLLSVSAEASIKELAAQVKLNQVFGNEADFPIEAVYAFPIPARAVVTGFCMIKQNGTRVVGRVQEKEEARKTYDSAVARGKQASLMEQQTPDVFQVAVGNIPAKEQVKIELVYATELTEDEENDSIRFHLPVHIGPRYGQAPTSALSRRSRRNRFANPSNTFSLNITTTIESASPINKIACPSHTVSTELGPDPALPNYKDLPFSNYARVSLSSTAPLDKDFVLTVKSAGLDAPRCVAELHSSPSQDTVALALTFVPRFKLPDVPRQEYIFVVDRSDSMEGARIAAARKALVVMLRCLPHKDSVFQICSFGSNYKLLWKESRPYNQDTLEEATRHIDTMKGDFGGTEIREALRGCFSARKVDRPTAVLVLTDGDAWDLDGVREEVETTVTAAQKSAPLQVSVLGIGDSVSTAMCEGIARSGNGTCILVGEQETSFTGKVARLLKAAKTPPISNISVDWGRVVEAVKGPEAVEEDFEMVDDVVATSKSKTLNVFDESVDPIAVEETAPPPAPPVNLPPPSAVQQSPFTIRNLFPGTRLNVYAILKGRTVPHTVILRGSTADGAQIELPVPVTLGQLQNDAGAPTAIHALAARKIIQDLEDGNHDLRATLLNLDDPGLLAQTVKASIVRLGITYSISSKHTSFVAVDETTEVTPVATERVESPKRSVRPRPQPRVVDLSSDSDGSVSHRVVTANRSRLARSKFLSAGSADEEEKAAVEESDGDSDGSGSVQSDGDSEMDWEPVADAEAEAEADEDSESDGDSESDMDMGFGGGGYPTRSAPKGGKTKPAVRTDAVEVLARLQSFDGRFTAQGVFDFVKLKDGVDLQAVRDLFPAGVADEVVATILAMAFLATRLDVGVERDSWEGMYEKAREYSEEASARMDAKFSVEELEAQVGKLLLA